MKTTCEFAEPWISVLIDGERMPEDVGRRLEEHLRLCEACRSRLEAGERLSARLTAALAADPIETARLKGAVLDGLRDSVASASAQTKTPTRAPTSTPIPNVARTSTPSTTPTTSPTPIPLSIPTPTPIPYQRRLGSPARSLGLAAAAALLVGLGWWLLAPTEPVSTDVGGGIAATETPSPSLPRTPKASPRPRLRVELERWAMHPDFVRDGKPMMRDVHRYRTIIFDPYNPPTDESSANPSPQAFEDVLLDEERVDSKLIQFTNWTFH